MDTKDTCKHIWDKIYNPHSMVPDIEIGRVFDILVEIVEEQYTSIEDPVARNILARLAVKGEESFKSIVSSVEFEIDMEDGEDFDDFDHRCDGAKRKRIEALVELEKQGLIKNTDDVYSLV